MSKKNLLIITFSFIALFLISIVIIFAPVFVFTEPAIINEIDNGVRLSGDRENPIIGGWEGYIQPSGMTKVIITNAHPFEPVVTLISQYSEDSKTIDAQVINMNRSGFLSFNVENYTAASFDNYSFNQAIEIVQKYNLAEENPDPENIFVVPQE